MRSGVTVSFLLALLAAAVAVAYWTWQELGDVAISSHGWLALGLGTIATCLVGAGLMALVFFSSRRGYDDRANHANDSHRHEPE